MLSVVGAVDEDALHQLATNWTNSLMTHILLDSFIVRPSHHRQTHAGAALQNKSVKGADPIQRLSVYLPGTIGVTLTLLGHTGGPQSCRSWLHAVSGFAGMMFIYRYLCGVQSV